MITSSLSRLASASTCLYGAKSPLCELAATRSENLIRSYTTAATASDPEYSGSKDQKDVLLAQRPQDPIQNELRPKPVHIPRPLHYTSTPIDLSLLIAKKKKTHKLDIPLPDTSKPQKDVLLAQRPQDPIQNELRPKSVHIPRPLHYTSTPVDLSSSIAKKKKTHKPNIPLPDTSKPQHFESSTQFASPVNRETPTYKKRQTVPTENTVTARDDERPMHENEDPPISNRWPKEVSLFRTVVHAERVLKKERLTVIRQKEEEDSIRTLPPDITEKKRLDTEESSSNIWPKEMPIFRTKVHAERVVKKEKPTVIRQKEEEYSIRTLPLDIIERNRLDAEESSSKFGPGFTDEPWTPEQWESDEGKKPPPHFVPTVNVNEGEIGPDVQDLIDVAAPTEQLPVAALEHGLDRVLFNPGVHWLQDPRSHVYNFTPWLEKIPKVNQFAFEKLTGFIKSSQDKDLRVLAKQEQKKYTGSTSSLTGMFSHIYFLISEHKDTELETLSQHFSLEPAAFTSGQRMASAVTLNLKDGIYSVDSLTSEYDDPDKNVLTWMGTLLENFLTKTPEDFKRFLRIESEPEETAEQKKLLREAYRFSKSNKFVMRSQLDCRDPRLPGTGIFDIKTRACISIRMDILNFEENSGYMIKSQHGIMESFEREYYDLVRSAFLKYSFQVRIGNMDGVMVAFHNTERIFGFQYISLDEMDERIYGPIPGIGDKVFKKSIGLLEAILDEATKHFPDQSVAIMFETRRPGKLMDVFVQPVEWTKQAPRPIRQLVVQVSHLVDGQPARSAMALRTTKEEWTMNYTIAKVMLPDDVIRHNLANLEKRKARTLTLPESVTIEKAKEYWENLSFNPRMKAVTKEFNPSAFTTADPAIQKFRDVSKEGRALYEELQRRQEGKPKIVLGQGVYEEEESLFFKEPSHAVRVEQAAEAAPVETVSSEVAPSDAELQTEAALPDAEPSSTVSSEARPSNAELSNAEPAEPSEAEPSTTETSEDEAASESDPEEKKE